MLEAVMDANIAEVKGKEDTYPSTEKPQWSPRKVKRNKETNYMSFSETAED